MAPLASDKIRLCAPLLPRQIPVL